MAVALRGSITSATTAAATSLAVTKPTGVASGDVIVIWVVSAAGITASCTGFTALASVLADGENLLWRSADGTEGSSFTVSWTGSGSSSAAILCAAFTNTAGGTTPFDPNNPAAAATASGHNGTPTIAGLENSASKATTTSGDMLVWLIDFTGNGTITYPTGFTGTTVSQSTTLSAGLGYMNQSSAGTTGTLSGSLGGTPLWGVQALAVTAGTTPPPAYAPRQARGNVTPLVRASSWRGWTKRLSGLVVPPFADGRSLNPGV